MIGRIYRHQLRSQMHSNTCVIIRDTCHKIRSLAFDTTCSSIKKLPPILWELYGLKPVNYLSVSYTSRDNQSWGYVGPRVSPQHVASHPVTILPATPHESLYLCAGLRFTITSLSDNRWNSLVTKEIVTIYIY